MSDTIRTVEGYADAIVLRHFAAGSARAAAAAAGVPIINAGDGPGQHPTQALLDVYTIRRELGRLDGVKVALVGDLANGRTARSLAYLLSSFPGVSFVFAAPSVVRMGADIKEFLTERGVPWEEVGGGGEGGGGGGRGARATRAPTLAPLPHPQADDLAAVASKCDVLYQTRIQKERFQVGAGGARGEGTGGGARAHARRPPYPHHQDRPDDYEAARGKFVVDTRVMDALPAASIVMHPLPRVDEIDRAVDADPRAAYFRQAKNGLFVRMALLKLALLEDA